jgi:predicted aconitase
LKTNQLGGQIGTDPIFVVSEAGGPRADRPEDFASGDELRLTTQEREVYEGGRGVVLQKTIRAVVAYGRLYGASHLVALDGAPHHALSWGSNGTAPLLKIYRQLVEAGLSTYAPFTANPRPMDPTNLPLTDEESEAVGKIYNRTDELAELYHELGMRSSADWSCASYLPEVGNTPDYGQALAWSESSAVVFVNSVIGARTNRNPIGIDMLCSILGKAPCYGLMTDDGRRATLLIDYRGSSLASPQIIGPAIGRMVAGEIPYITGLDRFLTDIDRRSIGFLKDLGAAIASNGGVGLFHLQGITPEAIRFGRELLTEDHRTRHIDDDTLARVRAGDHPRWRDPEGVPRRVFLGCPHLSVEQMVEWGERIVAALSEACRTTIALPTHFFGSPWVRKVFSETHPELAEALVQSGVTFPDSCPMMWCSTPLEGAEMVATNSTKTRVFTTARYFPDDVLTKLIVTGELPERAR